MLKIKWSSTYFLWSSRLSNDRKLRSSLYILQGWGCNILGMDLDFEGEKTHTHAHTLTWANLDNIITSFANLNGWWVISKEQFKYSTQEWPSSVKQQKLSPISPHIPLTDALWWSISYLITPVVSVWSSPNCKTTSNVRHMSPTIPLLASL